MWPRQMRFYCVGERHCCVVEGITSISCTLSQMIRTYCVCSGKCVGGNGRAKHDVRKRVRIGADEANGGTMGPKMVGFFSASYLPECEIMPVGSFVSRVEK